jgi:glycosyltransferase involved in cell wall biosynthesis
MHAPDVLAPTERAAQPHFRREPFKSLNGARGESGKELERLDVPDRLPARASSQAELWFIDDARIYGGGQRFAFKLACAAIAREPAIRPVMVCPTDSELAARSRESGFEVRNAYFPSVTPPSPRALGAILALRRVLARAPANAVFVANSPRTQAYAAAVRLLEHDLRPVVNVAHEQDTAGRLVARATLRRTGRVVAIGSNSASAYQRALPEIQVRRINNVLDDAELESARQARARRLRLGVLARMIPEKGILELLEEAAACAEHWSTLMVGAPPQDGDYEARVRERIGQLGLDGRARLLGEVFDVHAFLDSADVLVVPSTGYEGQPTAIIEALARGLPVLVREPILSEDFGGLPVLGYRNASDFGTALITLQPSLVSVEEMRRRFGADQAIDGLLLAAAPL